MEKHKELSPGDVVGKQGLEIRLENRLRGSKGRSFVEKDAHGRKLGKRLEKYPASGEDVRLSLDLNIQMAATAALGGEAGCIVVMEPDTGKLRALVTAPSYDNNIFTYRLPGNLWAGLRDDPRRPLYNRVIQSMYPPGSIWKLLMASLLLEEGIKPSETVSCAGEIQLGNRTFRCWRKGGHGRVDMVRSLVESCDVYYYTMADRVGIDKISRFASASGFGLPTGIDLPSENSGLVPSRKLKRDLHKESWQRGDTFNTAIGQGLTSITPVQMAVFVGSLLNGGKLMQPLLLDHAQPVVLGTIPASQNTRAFVVEAMQKTVESGSGTARRLFREGAVIGGKTGTAQVVKVGEVRTLTADMEYQHRDHAWIASWGRQGDKKYVVIVMVEHGGGGSSAAGPVAAKVYDYLFGAGPNRPSSPGAALAGKISEDYDRASVEMDNIVKASTRWNGRETEQAGHASQN
jgi:penicillin-binding protein 2